MRSKAGGRVPVRSEILGGLPPAQRYAAQRDLPDVLELADYGAAIDATLTLVQDRVRSGLVGTGKALFPLVKADPTKTRGLTVLDPLDDIALRVFVGRCSAAIAASTDETRVLNGIIRRPGPGWSTASFREQARKRRELQKTFVGAASTQAVGFFDVKNFFPSCRHDLIETLLAKAGAPGGAIDHVSDALDRIYGGSGRGLPIGFEGSGPIANLLLRPLDEALATSGRPFVRWTDDVEVFIRNRTEWTVIVEAAEIALRSVGLEFNLDKTLALPVGGPAEGRLFDPTRDSIFGADDPVLAIVDEFGWPAMLKSLGASGDMPPGRFRAFLGKLRTSRDPGAVGFIMAFPYWILREPRAVADYLIALLRNGPTASFVDRDWLMCLATDPKIGKQTAAGQLHLLRVLCEIPVCKTDGEQLLAFATDYGRLSRYGELCAWAMRAWAKSDHWNPGDSLDLVTVYSHISLQRAALSGFLHRPPGRSKVSGLQARAKVSPGLRPVVTLVSP